MSKEERSTEEIKDIVCRNKWTNLEEYYILTLCYKNRASLAYLLFKNVSKGGKRLRLVGGYFKFIGDYLVSQGMIERDVDSIRYHMNKILPEGLEYQSEKTKKSKKPTSKTKTIHVACLAEILYKILLRGLEEINLNNIVNKTTCGKAENDFEEIFLSCILYQVSYPKFLIFKNNFNFKRNFLKNN